ncbi:hypothetical protein [Roseateles sp.]|uniref:hypothetical protein n=1 Tax=Roseateles sp. TaxID=1971397 RepID=UPI0025F099E9|nr:hypothetical protein [Roseateles sp.]MBV8033976.1 hypothetical protein [Roseateles sp.]
MLPPAIIFEQIVSKPRLDSYRGYWKVGPEAAVGLYMWNGEVCGEVGKLLSYFEVVLRNNIHRELSLHTTAGVSSSTHWWDHLAGQLKSGTLSKIADVRADAHPAWPTPDEIVSRLSFGFWPNVLTWIAKQRPTLMPKILPAHPLSLPGAAPNWSNPAARRDALTEFFEIKDLRNRIAHHEPLWKFAPVMDTSTSPATVVAPASTDEASSLVRFGRLLQRYDQAVGALSPDLFAHIRISTWRARLEYLLSSRGLERYKAGGHIAEASFMSTLALRQQFASIVQRNKPVRVFDHGGEGIFIPS